MAVRSERTIDQNSEWLFYVILEFESLDKKRIFMEDRAYSVAFRSENTLKG